MRHSRCCQCSECQLHRRTAQLRESIQRGMDLVASRQAQSILTDFALDWAALYEGLNGLDELGISLVQLKQRLHVTV